MTTLNPQYANSQISNRIWLGPLLIVLTVFAGLVFFRSGLFSLLQAWQRPEYSHGYIIPVIAAYLALKRVEAPSDGRGWMRPASFVLLLLGLLFGLVGNLATIADLTTYGLLLAIAALVLLTLGSKTGYKLWPAWVYLGFMLPLPNFIYWPLSIKLQFLSSQIGVGLIKLLGVPVFLDGNIIDLGSYKLQVAEACSGLRYLFPLMSFGFLFACLYRGPWWQKSLLFLTTIPITILMNSVRIGVIGFLVDRYGIAQAEGFLHVFEGWVIFVICILLLFGLALLFQRLLPGNRRLPLADVLDFSFADVTENLRKLRNMAPVLWLGLFAFATTLAAASSLPLFEKSSVYPQRKGFAEFPAQIAGWSGERAFLNFDIERVLGADDYLMSDYTKTAPTRESVNLLISYYRAQNEGSGIHSPEVCIPAGGWEVSRWEKAEVKLDVAGMEQLAVNRAIIQKGIDRQLVYYWFQQRGRNLTNDYVAKLYTIWDSVVRRRSDGALIRVVTPIDGNDLAAADDRLRRFLNDTGGTFAAFVPP